MGEDRCMPAPLRLYLELEVDPTEPIAGTLTGSGGDERRFTGWLELLAALEAACAGVRPEPREPEGERDES